jgi:hypothetical protein
LIIAVFLILFENYSAGLFFSKYVLQHIYVAANVTANVCGNVCEIILPVFGPKAVKRVINGVPYI